jgi:hypothetical protein
VRTAQVTPLLVAGVGCTIGTSALYAYLKTSRVLQQPPCSPGCATTTQSAARQADKLTELEARMPIRAADAAAA